MDNIKCLYCSECYKHKKTIICDKYDNKNFKCIICKKEDCNCDTNVISIMFKCTHCEYKSEHNRNNYCCSGQTSFSDKCICLCEEHFQEIVIDENNKIKISKCKCLCEKHFIPLIQKSCIYCINDVKHCPVLGCSKNRLKCVCKCVDKHNKTNCNCDCLTHHYINYCNKCIQNHAQDQIILSSPNNINIKYISMCASYYINVARKHGGIVFGSYVRDVLCKIKLQDNTDVGLSRMLISFGDNEKLDNFVNEVIFGRILGSTCHMMGEIKIYHFSIKDSYEDTVIDCAGLGRRLFDLLTTMEGGINIDMLISSNGGISAWGKYSLTYIENDIKNKVFRMTDEFIRIVLLRSNIDNKTHIDLSSYYRERAFKLLVNGWTSMDEKGKEIMFDYSLDMKEPWRIR